jgi:UDP-N-acetylglucosamine--N-acetylmuramyl-(pentapeptide) pyrophosphoryl-undecaprenol N-acetylglucosamine transferase
MATLLIVAGGSGGHIVPGLAIAEEWKKTYPEDKICFVTSGRAVERFFQAELTKYQVIELNVPAFSELRKSPWRFTREFWRSYVAAAKMLGEIKPAAVMGMGAMTSVPVILSASRKKIPIILHEQNKVAGRATRHLARFAKVVCTSFQETAGLTPDSKQVWTGNPVRQPATIDRSSPQLSPATLLVLGGSQGARHLNLAIEELVRLHPEIMQQYKLIHQVGAGFHSVNFRSDDVHNMLDSSRMHSNWEQHEFLQPISAFYSQARVVICRAGAGTLAELALWKLPAIIVPYPQAVQQHQLANAREYVAHQAGLLVEEANTPTETAQKLWEQLQIIKESAIIEQIKLALGQMAKPEAASKICGELAKVIHP